jgi:hypothetical protein
LIYWFINWLIDWLVEINWLIVSRTLRQVEHSGGWWKPEARTRGWFFIARRHCDETLEPIRATDLKERHVAMAKDVHDR